MTALPPPVPHARHRRPQRYAGLRTAALVVGLVIGSLLFLFALISVAAFVAVIL